MRDDFPRAVVETLAKRVGNRCSNPGCRKLTSGPHTECEKVLNVGVAAHVTAASPGGPRYDASLTSEGRKGIGNGIWLCQSCAKLVDNDETRYTKELLTRWKCDAEQEALREIESPSGTIRPSEMDGGNVALPTIEVMEATIECKPPILGRPNPAIHIIKPVYGDDRLVWTVSATLFMQARTDDTLTIPLHRCSGWLEDRYTGECPLRDVKLQSERQSRVRIEDAVIVVTGPGKFNIQGFCETPYRDRHFSDDVTAVLLMPISERNNQPIRIELNLPAAHQVSGGWPLQWHSPPTGGQ